MQVVGNGEVMRQFQAIFNGGVTAGLTDAELLERFASHRTGPLAEAAFTVIVERHGPMVLTTCRHLIGPDRQTAEDAFQAVFLVLVRKSGSLRVTGSLGGWLYGVAHRVASKARAGRHREGLRERADPDAAVDLAASDLESPEAAFERAELRRILHEELRRLPEKYRVPLVLCYLEGLTHEQAAARLNWPVGTVRGRMARARDLLRTRLTRRGATLPAGGLAMVVGRDAAAAFVPHVLVNSTVKAAVAVSGAAGGTAALAGLASSAALTLAQGATRSMLILKLKFAAAGIVALGATVGGAGVYVQESGGLGSSGVGQPATLADEQSRDAGLPVADESPASELSARQQVVHHLTHLAAKQHLEQRAEIKALLEAAEREALNENDPKLVALRLEYDRIHDSADKLWEERVAAIRQQTANLRDENLDEWAEDANQQSTELRSGISDPNALQTSFAVGGDEVVEPTQADPKPPAKEGISDARAALRGTEDAILARLKETLKKLHGYHTRRDALNKDCDWIELVRKTFEQVTPPASAELRAEYLNQRAEVEQLWKALEERLGEVAMLSKRAEADLLHLRQLCIPFAGGEAAVDTAIREHYQSLGTKPVTYQVMRPVVQTRTSTRQVNSSVKGHDRLEALLKEASSQRPVETEVDAQPGGHR